MNVGEEGSSSGNLINDMFKDGRKRKRVWQVDGSFKYVLSGELHM
jgi:hypothetical protein